MFVGLISPEALALGAAIGFFENFKKFWAILFFGTLIAMLFRPDVARDEIPASFFLGSTNVKGPGQNILASCVDISSNSTNFLACL